MSQAHDTGSHLHNDVWAWDFRMPTGTPIVAARDGLVRMARGDSTQGGCDSRFAAQANYVVVDHGDGLETQYLHFSTVSVRKGQRVRKGELLGFSGSTGWSCGPHLHFKVARATGSGWNNPSVPAHIEGFGDPQKGTWINAPSCAPEVLTADAKESAQTNQVKGSGAAKLVHAVEQREALADTSTDERRPSTATDGGTPTSSEEMPQLGGAATERGEGGTGAVR